MSKIIGAKVGDTVYVDGYTSMAQQNSGREVIDKITTKYDEETGEPYDVIWINKNHQFDSRSGIAITPPTMYYIDNLKMKKRKKKTNVQAIDVPLTIKRKTEDGKIIILPNTHPQAGKTIFIKHKPNGQ